MTELRKPRTYQVVKQFVEKGRPLDIDELFAEAYLLYQKPPIRPSGVPRSAGYITRNLKYFVDAVTKDPDYFK